MSATPIDRKHIPGVLDAIASGSSLRTACEEVGYKWSTFLDWVAADTSLADQYARARTLQAEHYADEIIRIVDGSLDPQKARLQMDARKWIASKLLPKKYGDKLELGSDGTFVPPVINVTLAPPSEPTL